MGEGGYLEAALRVVEGQLFLQKVRGRFRILRAQEGSEEGVGRKSEFGERVVQSPGHTKKKEKKEKEKKLITHAPTQAGRQAGRQAAGD